MSRDYRHAEVFSPGTRPLPLWLWLFAVLAVGAFVGLIYYLDTYQKTKNQTSIEAPASAKSSTDMAAPQQKSDDNKPHFDFYKLLPKLSVDIPKVDITKRTQPQLPAQQPVIQPLNTQPVNAPPLYSYVLQAGSFKEYNEADRLKANLALSGIQANIEKVVLNGSQVWHRVRVGPIRSEREMNKIRGQLRDQNIEPIMLKIKDQ